MAMNPKQIGKTAAIANIAVNGAVAIPGAIEQYRSIKFAQTTTGITVSIPAPSDATVMFGLDISNTGSANFTITGIGTVAAGASMRANWTGAGWSAVSAAAMVGSAVSANGAAGIVPTPAINTPYAKLIGSGVWDIADSYQVFDVPDQTVSSAFDASNWGAIDFNQTTPGIAITLSPATPADKGRRITAANYGTVAISLDGQSIAPGAFVVFNWSPGVNAWMPASSASVTTTPLDYAVIMAAGMNGSTQLVNFTSAGTAAGAVHPGILRAVSARIPLDANGWSGELVTDIRSSGITTGPNNVTIAKSGRYHISASASIVQAQYLLQIVKNGTAVLGYSAGYASVSGRIPTDAEWLGDLVAGDTIELRADGASAGGQAIDNLKLIIQQVATESVVDPNLVPVTALHYGHASWSAASAGTQKFAATGSTTPLVVAPAGARFPFASANVLTSTGVTVDNANSRFTITQAGRYLITANASGLVGGAACGPQIVRNGTTVLDAGHFYNGGATGLSPGVNATWEGDLAVGDTIDGRLWSSTGSTTVYSANLTVTQLASHTVIDSNDVAVNDQAASGYIDIGTMRIQWGTAVSGSAAVFPAAFANASYRLTVSHTSSSAFYTTGAHTKTATGFTANAYNSVGAVANGFALDWIAIGLKP